MLSSDSQKLLDCIKNFLSSTGKNRVEYAELLTFGFEPSVLSGLLAELERNSDIERDRHYINSAVYLKQ